MKDPNELQALSDKIDRFLSNNKKLTEPQIKALLTFIKETKPYATSSNITLGGLILFNIAWAYYNPIAEMQSLSLIVFACSVTQTIYATGSAMIMRAQIFFMERALLRELEIIRRKG